MLCPKCGVELKVVDNRWYCPNDGFVEEERGEEDDSPRSYIG